MTDLECGGIYLVELVEVAEYDSSLRETVVGFESERESEGNRGRDGCVDKCL